MTFACLHTKDTRQRDFCNLGGKCFDLKEFEERLPELITPTDHRSGSFLKHRFVVFVCRLLLSDSCTSQTNRRCQPHIGHSGFPHLPKTRTVEEKVRHRIITTPWAMLGPVTIPRVVRHSVPEGRALLMDTFGEKNSCRVRFLNSQLPGCYVLAFKGMKAKPSRYTSRFSPETAFFRGLAWPPSLLLSLRPESNAPTVASVGKKEPTGFGRMTSSNQIFPDTPFDCSHFNTTYKSSFRPDDDSKDSLSGRIGARSICGTRDSGYSRRGIDHVQQTTSKLHTGAKQGLIFMDKKNKL
uniref:Uncharacterized protein n=1 Tax=Gasterosteus aculeatus aculeatus TaxID=481459 RepID=A0AAQ4RAR7_GASAC